MADQLSPLARLREFAASDYFKSQQFKRVQLVARMAVLVGVFAYLIWRLSSIGWIAVLQALPTAPLFYLIFAVRYCVLPTTEMLIYRRLWNVHMAPYWPVFFRKRVFNFGVLDYSGEAYFLAWARATLRLPDKTAFAAIRDSNVLSAIASNLITVLFLFIFVWQGLADTLSTNTPNAWIYILSAGFIAVFLTAVIVTFRRHLIGVSRDMALWLLGMHGGRMLLILLLLGAQWASALPAVPLSVWWLFLTANLVLNRLPFLPNKDLMFLGLGVGLAEYVDGPEAAIAAVFVASSALTQLTNLLVFAATTFVTGSSKSPRDPESS